MINEVILGDCLEVMKDIPAESVDMILCDLPYGTTQNKWDGVIDLSLLWEQYRRIIKRDGVIVLTAQTPFDKVLGASNLVMLKYEWIWSKSRATGHLNAKKMPLKAHENILVFYKEPPVYNPQELRRKERVTIRKGRDNGTNYGKSNKDAFQEFENYPTSIIHFPHEIGFHPTQKPVGLFEYLIRTYTNQGNTVLDNCSGSGTTAIACINSGRNYILIEKDPEYFELSRKRIAGHAQPLILN